MEVVKKIASELEVGDVLVLDLIEIDKTRGISLSGGSDSIGLLIDKLEGESAIFLYEIDDIDMDWNGYPTSEPDEDIEKNPDKYGLVYEFYHMSQITTMINGETPMPLLKVKNYKYKFDVVKPKSYSDSEKIFEKYIKRSKKRSKI